MLNFFVQSRTHLSLPTACLRAFKTRRDWLRDDSTGKLSLSSSPFSLTHEQILEIEVFNRSSGGEKSCCFHGNMGWTKHGTRWNSGREATRPACNFAWDRSSWTGLDNNETMTTELKIEFRHDYRNREVGGAGYHWRRRRSMHMHTQTHKRACTARWQTGLPLRKWILKGTSQCLLFVSARPRIWWAGRQTAPWSESLE